MTPAASEAQREYDKSQLEKAFDAAQQVSGASALALLGAVEQALSTRDWPSLFVVISTGGTQPDRYDLVCPHCRKAVGPHDLRSVDTAQRWTKFDEFDFAEGSASIVYDETGDFESLGYMHLEEDREAGQLGCRGFVDLPDGWMESTL